MSHTLNTRLTFTSHSHQKYQAPCMYNIVLSLFSSSVVPWQLVSLTHNTLASRWAESQGRGETMELLSWWMGHHCQMSSPTHGMLPSNSQVLLSLLCLSNHIIDQICSPSPSPCPVWSPPPWRDVFERLPQQREKAFWACLWLSPPHCESSRISLSCKCICFHQLCVLPLGLSSQQYLAL